jgi:hypothetical protein
MKPRVGGEFFLENRFRVARDRMVPPRTGLLP